jgi:tetratricopeptide (TPR) repeat protein
MEGADSVQIGHSRLALSTLLFEQKRAADAVQFLQLQIETAPRSVVAAEAGFNLGKCLMVLNERTDAKMAFLKSIDASGGPVDVKVASYIFHCRMLLEEGHQQAITTMMRGLALSEGSEMESWASLQLASAYLLKNVPQGANSVLMNHTDSFAEGDAKAAGAFASALSRFRAAVLSDRREREGADVVAALAEFNAADACGGHWAVLVAGACEELGLTQQAGEAYDFALQRLPECVLRDATTMKLAEHYKQQNEPEQARLLLTSLTASQAGELAADAKLETAQLALEQSRLKDAIKISRELFISTKSMKDRETMKPRSIASRDHCQMTIPAKTLNASLRLLMESIDEREYSDSSTNPADHIRPVLSRQPLFDEFLCR